MKEKISIILDTEVVDVIHRLSEEDQRKFSKYNNRVPYKK